MGCDSQLSRGNTVGHTPQFGIMREAALYAGHGPRPLRCSLTYGVSKWQRRLGNPTERQSKVNFSNEIHDSPTEKFCAAVEVWVMLCGPQFNLSCLLESFIS